MRENGGRTLRDKVINALGAEGAPNPGELADEILVLVRDHVAAMETWNLAGAPRGVYPRSGDWFDRDDVLRLLGAGDE